MKWDEWCQRFLTLVAFIASACLSVCLSHRSSPDTQTDPPEGGIWLLSTVRPRADTLVMSRHQSVGIQRNWCPSVRLVCLSVVCFRAIIRTLIRNPVLEVEPTGQRGQKHPWGRKKYVASIWIANEVEQWLLTDMNRKSQTGWLCRDRRNCQITAAKWW